MVNQQLFGLARECLYGLNLPIVPVVEIEINFIKNNLELRQKSKVLPLTLNQLGLITGRTLTKLISLLSWGIVGLALILSISYFGPQIYSRVENFISPQVTSVQVVDSPVTQIESPVEVKSAKFVPPQDENLPIGDWLIIPRIGVRTELLQTQTSVEALNQGVWQVPDFGDPGSLDQPMIVAAHRFGYTWQWQTYLEDDTPYALRHLFYKLPETESGDMVEIIHDQRRYRYVIYAGEENTQITDYEADLILYTCKYLNAPERLIRYARLLVD